MSKNDKKQVYHISIHLEDIVDDFEYAGFSSTDHEYYLSKKAFKIIYEWLNNPNIREEIFEQMKILNNSVN